MGSGINMEQFWIGALCGFIGLVAGSIITIVLILYCTKDALGKKINW